MLSKAFWKTGHCLFQFQLRSKFRVEVCYIKQWCALNKGTHVDNFESLATNAEAETHADASIESELNYFATEVVTPKEQPKSRHKGKPPLRQTLAYTNRVLFGPLLETLAEKKRRIKAEEEAELEEEEGEGENTQKTRKRKKGKKKKKKKSPEITEPLIIKPENAHFLGLFPGYEPLKYVDKVQVRRVEIETQDSNITVPKSKMLLFKKSSKKNYTYDISQLKDTPTVHKLYVASWNKGKEGSVSSSIDEDLLDKPNVSSGNQDSTVNVSPSTSEGLPEKNRKTSEDDILSGNISEDNDNGYKIVYSSSDVRNETLACDSSDLKSDTSSPSLESENDDVQSLKSNRGGSCRSSDLESKNDKVQTSESYRETSLELKDDMITCSSSDLEEEEDDELLQELQLCSKESPSDTKGNTTKASYRQGESNEEIQSLEPHRETPSLLHIDNTKFPSAPSVIDAEMIQNFPLEKTTTDLPGVQSEAMMNSADGSNDNVLTIGMFDGGYQRLPSVSKILEATMSEADRKVLERWKAKMIRELGEEGFERYRQGLFDKGKLLHGCIHSQLTGVSPGVENLPTVQGMWTSISHVLPSITNVAVLESRLVHPYLYYQGAVDCVATYKGMPVLIDWKTSTKPKLTLKSMFDNPLQLVAYLGALNYDSHYQLPHHVQSAMIVVAYDSGLPAHVHILDREKCQVYWRLWCGRLVQFWRQQQVQEST